MLGHTLVAAPFSRRSLITGGLTFTLTGFQVVGDAARATEIGSESSKDGLRPNE